MVTATLDLRAVNPFRARRSFPDALVTALQNRRLRRVLLTAGIVGLAALSLGPEAASAAADPAVASMKITRAVHVLDTGLLPLFKIIQALGVPILTIMLGIAALQWMLGNREKALKMSKEVIIGFLFLEFVPFLVGVIGSVGQALTDSLPSMVE